MSWNPALEVYLFTDL